MMLFAPSLETQHCPTCVKENTLSTGVIATRRVGAKLYELTDHLGNVRAVIGDVKLAEGGSFKVDLKSYTNYYPYGMEQPQRAWRQGEDYRYGYNGVEEDDELKGEGNSLSTYYRLYDPRLALWLGIDPVVHESESPYAFSSGNPVLNADPDGDTPGTINDTQTRAENPEGGGPQTGQTPTKPTIVPKNIAPASSTATPTAQGRGGSTNGKKTVQTSNPTNQTQAGRVDKTKAVASSTSTQATATGMNGLTAKKKAEEERWKMMQGNQTSIGPAPSQPIPRIQVVRVEIGGEPHNVRWDNSKGEFLPSDLSAIEGSGGTINDEWYVKWGSQKPMEQFAALAGIGAAHNPYQERPASGYSGTPLQARQPTTTPKVNKGTLGDLTPAETIQIQGVVNTAQKPIEIVGSAAKGQRKGVGLNIPIKKGVKSDIDYLAPGFSIPYFMGMELPGIDNTGIIPGVGNPYQGPIIRFEPFTPPVFIPFRNLGE